MYYERVIPFAGIGFSVLAGLIAFFQLWNMQYEVLNTLYSAAAGTLVLLALLVANRMAMEKLFQLQRN